jgi:hypothetical protein
LVELAAKLVCALESSQTRCAPKQTVVTVGASQQASEAKVLDKMQASAQNLQSEVRVVTVAVVVQAVHETTATVVVSAPLAQIVLLVPSEHPAKTYHQ